MIAMAVTSVLFLGSCILGALALGFSIGFVVGYLACIEQKGKEVLATAGGILLLAIASLAFFSGCSPVVQESVTVTDVEKTLPVPGDTVSVLAKSDSFYVRTSDRSWMEFHPVTPAYTPEVSVPGEARVSVYFRASVDTTVNGVRMRIGYSYPEDLFDILVEQARREVKYRDRDTSGMRVVDRPRDVVPIWVYIVTACALAMMIYSVVLTIKARS